MKLAQALTLRKQMKNSLSVIGAKAQRNAARAPGYDGKLPPQAGDPNEDVRDMISAADKLEELINAINTANLATLPNGLTISAALVKRDTYIQLASLLSQLGSIRSRGGDVLELDVKTVGKMADNYARQARELDDLIQQANWNIDLA